MSGWTVTEAEQVAREPAAVRRAWERKLTDDD
jgi:hypothetical protein